MNTLGDKETVTSSEKQSAQWLNAWHDPVANVKAYSNCIGLADLNTDGDHKLLIADLDRKLKVFKGTSLISEHVLLDVPVALCSYYMDESSPKTPAIAIASGPHIFIYRNLRPYYKFTLPPLQIETLENDTWNELKEDKITLAKANEKLTEAREKGLKLTSRSLDFISIEDSQQKLDYVNNNKNIPLVSQTVITCMTVLKKSREEDTAIGGLVIGTESNNIMLLEPSASAIHKKLQLRGIPVFMVASGLSDVEYRIVVACRNGSVYTIKNGEISAIAIELDIQPVGLVRIDRHILVGCMNNVIHAYQIRGKKSFSIYLPASITNMEALHHEATNTKALITALDNGEIRVYNEKHLVSVLQTNDIVTGMKFGPFGREAGSLIVTFASGAVSCKILSRNSTLAPPTGTAKPPPEQDIPLKVPKKTKLYMEQSQRERDNSIEMHRIFQRELYKLRLSTARSYVKVITDTQGPVSYTSGTSVRLSAQAAGIGPIFKLKITLENTGKRVLTNIPITFKYNHSLYKMRKSIITAPVLVPGLVYQYEVVVECIQDTGTADSIHIFVCNPAKSALPIITYIVNMPVSELFFEP